MPTFPHAVKVTTTETAEGKDSWGNPIQTESPVVKEINCSVRVLDSTENIKRGVAVVDTLWRFQTKEFWPGNHENTVSWPDPETGATRTGQQHGSKKVMARGTTTNNTLIHVVETGQGDSSG